MQAPTPAPARETVLITGCSSGIGKATAKPPRAAGTA
jgi:NADP-dependent 3-hydroxy acid dehydrogenase YdfG